MKTRQLHDSKQTTIKITNDTGEFEIDDIKDIIGTFETSAKSKNHNIQTMVRILTAIGIRTVKFFSGDWKLQEYEEYLDGKVAETGKFEKISYIEVTVIKSFGIADYFA